MDSSLAIPRALSRTLPRMDLIHRHSPYSVSHIVRNAFDYYRGVLEIGHRIHLCCLPRFPLSSPSSSCSHNNVTSSLTPVDVARRRVRRVHRDGEKCIRVLMYVFAYVDEGYSRITSIWRRLLEVVEAVALDIFVPAQQGRIDRHVRVCSCTCYS